MTLSNCHILVTGANGFIGKNLIVRLGELQNVTVSTFVRGDDVSKLRALLAHVDFVVHLAGENRPIDQGAFEEVNIGLTEVLCEALALEYQRSGRQLPLVLASSSQAESDNPYGKSKLMAEKAVEDLCFDTGHPAVIYRLPGVFGKWCKPNYNSVVATFCHNIINGLPIRIDNPSRRLQLVYVDDVVSSFIAALCTPSVGLRREEVTPLYTTTLGELAKQLHAFGDCRTKLMGGPVGTGFLRALYATYVSYLPDKCFAYEVPQHVDARGVFVEVLKTPDCGQFSYFTALPGVTRGGHYHHTKTEKFLVLKGEARFRFKNILTKEYYELRTSGEMPEVVDTVPGWIHDITNVGPEELIVMLWANENFDRQNPDTVESKL